MAHHQYIVLNVQHSGLEVDVSKDFLCPNTQLFMALSSGDVNDKCFAIHFFPRFGKAGDFSGMSSFKDAMIPFNDRCNDRVRNTKVCRADESCLTASE